MLVSKAMDKNINYSASDSSSAQNHRVAGLQIICLQTQRDEILGNGIGVRSEIALRRSIESSTHPVEEV
jgi:hypothetical protein